MGDTAAVKLAGGWDSHQPYNGYSEEFFLRAKRAKLKVSKCGMHVSYVITHYNLHTISYFKLLSRKIT